MEINRDTAKKVLDTVDAGLSLGIGERVPGKMCVEAAVCYALGLPHGDDPICVSRALRSLKIRLNDAGWSSNEARAKGLRRLALAQLGSMDTLDDREFAQRVATLAIKTSVPTALRAAAELQKDVSHRKMLEDAAVRCENEGTVESADSASSAAASAYSAAYSAYSAYSAAYSAYSAYSAAYSAYSAYSAADSAYSAYSAADSAYSAASSADSAAYTASAAYSASSADSAARDSVLASFAEGVVQILIEMHVPGCQWLGLTEE